MSKPDLRPRSDCNLTKPECAELGRCSGHLTPVTSNSSEELADLGVELQLNRLQRMYLETVVTNLINREKAALLDELEPYAILEPIADFIQAKRSNLTRKEGE